MPSPVRKSPWNPASSLFWDESTALLCTRVSRQHRLFLFSLALAWCCRTSAPLRSMLHLERYSQCPAPTPTRHSHWPQCCSITVLSPCKVSLQQFDTTKSAFTPPIGPIRVLMQDAIIASSTSPHVTQPRPLTDVYSPRHDHAQQTSDRQLLIKEAIGIQSQCVDVCCQFHVLVIPSLATRPKFSLLKTNEYIQLLPKQTFHHGSPRAGGITASNPTGI